MLTVSPGCAYPARPGVDGRSTATACLPAGTEKVTGVVATAAGPTGTVRTSAWFVAAAMGAPAAFATGFVPERSPKNASAAPTAKTATPTKRMLFDLPLFMSTPDTGTVRMTAARERFRHRKSAVHRMLQ